MAFDEAKKAVVTAIETRMNDKIIGPFSISWCLFNWKAIATVVFPSSISLTDRFMALEKLGYVGLHPYDHMIVYPALSTLLFIFAIAYFSLHLVSWETWIQNKKNLARKELIHVVPIEEVTPLHDQISKLRQETRTNEQFSEERGKQLREREQELANKKRDLNDIVTQRDGLQAMVSEQERVVKSLTTEKDVSAENLVKLQNEFDIQKSLLAETIKKLEAAEMRSKEISQASNIIQQNYQEAIANKEREIGLLKQVSSGLESKIAQQDAVLEDLKKNNKGLLGLPGFLELLHGKDAGKQGFGLPVSSSGENDKARKTLNSLANALTKGLEKVSPQITSFINKLRFGKISEKDLDLLRMLLLEERNSRAGQEMVDGLISEARQILFQSK